MLWLGVVPWADCLDHCDLQWVGLDFVGQASNFVTQAGVGRCWRGAEVVWEEEVV